MTIVDPHLIGQTDRARFGQCAKHICNSRIEIDRRNIDGLRLRPALPAVLGDVNLIKAVSRVFPNGEVADTVWMKLYLPYLLLSLFDYQVSACSF